MIDGVEFFKNHKNWKFPFFLSTPQWYIAWRIAGFSLWAKHRVTFVDAVRNATWAPFKTERVRKKIWDALADVFMEEVNHEFPKDEMKIYGRLFHIANDSRDTDKWISTFKMINESIAMDQYQAKKYLKPDSVVVDAGANIGVFSVFAATLCPQGFVYSFEPDPLTFAILKKNLSQYPNAKAYQTGLGEKRKKATLIKNLTTPTASAFEDSGMKSDPSDLVLQEKATIRTIDSLKLPRLDFLKMDTEGYEDRILIGAKETIAQYRPVIAMEIHHPGVDETKIPRILNSFAPGYAHSIKLTTERNMIFIPSQIG